MSAHSHLKQIIESHEILTREEARTLMQHILAGELSDLQLAALLGALATRGPAPTEIAGFVDVMRSAATPIPLSEAEQRTLTDTCGTGADSSGTFNISTAAALVAAAAGATVAKHGNRAVTSRSGSADVLEALGIPVALSPNESAAALRKHRFAFLHAPNLHPGMKIVMPVRRALGIRTIFHLVGPLSNPAGASTQVMGVYDSQLVPVVAEAMAILGTRHAFVVHGSIEADQGMDELSISGPSQIAEVRNGQVTLTTLIPEDVGLTPASVDTLLGGDAQTNAAILTTIFAGEAGPRRDVVLLNAAAVLITAGLATDLPGGIALAARAIDTGAVTALVVALAASHPTEP